jgi:hypothetical protein
MRVVVVVDVVAVVLACVGGGDGQSARGLVHFNVVLVARGDPTTTLLGGGGAAAMMNAAGVVVLVKLVHVQGYTGRLPCRHRLERLCVPSTT